MARTQTMVQLSEELLTLLDEEATRRGVSRSSLIRTAIEAFLHEEHREAIDRRIVEGYRRIPPAAPDEWGDMATLSDAATADLLRRLDAEEGAEGHAPW